MKYYKHTSQLEVYELLDRVIATTDEETFYAQLTRLLNTRQSEGYSFGDYKPAVLPHRKAWRIMTRKIKK